jgi:hypothetical protein
MRYAIVIEKAPVNYAAYVPIAGVHRHRRTVAETESLMRGVSSFT